MSNENSNSKNSPENKKRSWHKEPWYKRLSTRFWYRIFFRASMSGKYWKSSGRYMITADLSVRYANVGVRNAEK